MKSDHLHGVFNVIFDLRLPNFRLGVLLRVPILSDVSRCREIECVGSQDHVLDRSGAARILCVSRRMESSSVKCMKTKIHNKSLRETHGR